jgi:hypothetical protein
MIGDLWFANVKLARNVRSEKGAGPQRETDAPGNRFAPPGSNRSGGRGNEVAEAFGVEGRDGDLASVQAIIRVNAEQTSKRLMQEPTLRFCGEGRSQGNGTSEWVP